MKRRITSFIAFYIPCFVVQVVGGLMTQQSVTTWYPTLMKSQFTPPGFVFGIAWTILYALMALAASRVYVNRGTWRSRSLVFWAAQLLLGLIWTGVFFGMREINIGAHIILFSWGAAVITAERFWRIEKLAGWLMAPLVLWLTFATYLNVYIATHN